MLFDSYTMIYTEWTEEREQLLRELNDTGSNAWIAREINKKTGSNFSRNAIIGKRNRLGLQCTKVFSRGPKEAKDRVKKPKKPRHFRYGFSAFGEPIPADLEFVRKFERRIPPAIFLGVPLLELKNNSCRFPRGEKPILFCGQPKREGSSYCAYCHSVVWRSRSAIGPRYERFAKVVAA